MDAYGADDRTKAHLLHLAEPQQGRVALADSLLGAPVAVDTVVALSSGDPLVSVPGTVTILAGSRTASFTVSAGTTAKSKNVTVTATKNGVSLGKGVKVLP